VGADWLVGLGKTLSTMLKLIYLNNKLVKQTKTDSNQDGSLDDMMQGVFVQLLVR